MRTHRINAPTLRHAARSAAVALGCLAAAASAESLSVAVTDAAGAPLADAVVWAVPQGAPAPAAATPPATAAIDQIKRRFVPAVSVVRTGTAVSFPNMDNIRHHVYSFSAAKAFEIKLYSGVPSEPIVFDKPGLVVLGCNIHDQMVGHLMVVDTPHFALSGADGTARLASLPPGAYQVHVWHPDHAADAPSSLRVDVSWPASASARLQTTAR
jgi:plastocyanin